MQKSKKQIHKRSNRRRSSSSSSDVASDNRNVNKDMNSRIPPDTFVELELNPLNAIRFAHSKIRPVFSGCGRTLNSTLQSLLTGQMQIKDLPMITVIQGDGGDGWYFSLNNRRLWVLKQCAEQGLISTVRVRARCPKPHEISRYTVDKCSLYATLMREKHSTDNSRQQDNNAT